MTISSSVRTAGPFLGDGLTTVFPFSFKVFQQSDLLVGETDPSFTQTTLVLSSGYTVTLNSNQDVAPGGTITLAVALAVGSSLSITSAVPLTQPLQLTTAGGFFPQNIEDALDRLTILMQQQNGGQSIRVPEIEGAPLLDSAPVRANRILGFDGTGKPIAILPAPGDSTSLALDIMDTSSSSKGAGQVGFNANLNYVSGVGQALEDSEWSLFWFPAVRAAVAAGTDCTSAVAAVVALKVAAGGGSLFAPRAPVGGGWLFSGGAASADGYKNGILFPFSTVNADPTTGMQLRGEQGTRFMCGSNNMILLRIARNCVNIKDIVLDCNGKTSVILCGIVPEDMTQTTTLVSQQNCKTSNVVYVGGAGVDGRVYQPGPHVGSDDSGCFFFDHYSDWFDFVGGGRAVYSKKNADWATHPNRAGDINFHGESVVRGNVGHYLEVGSGINFYGGRWNQITSGVTPCATPTAVYLSVDTSLVEFHAGRIEACTRPVDALSSDNIRSYGLVSTTAFPANWFTNVEVFGDANVPSSATITVAGTGGTLGTVTTAAVTFYTLGKAVFVAIVINVAKGTASGPITLSGLPRIAKTLTAGFQWLHADQYTGVTMGTNTDIGGRIAGASMDLIFSQSGNPVAFSDLSGASLVINFSGCYMAA